MINSFKLLSLLNVNKMPHVFFLLLIFFGIIYGIFKAFVALLDAFVLIDERFVSNVKEKNNSLLNFFLGTDEDESINKNNRSKMKRINSALRFDFFISTFMAILWFIYPFMLIQLTADQIAKKSPEDKYIGRWLALMVIFSNIMSLRFIKNGKLLSKQSILLVKLVCACIVLITTLMITIFTKKLYLSNIINIILTSIWLSNSAVGLFLSHSKKDI